MRTGTPARVVSAQTDSTGELTSVTLDYDGSPLELPCTRLIAALGFKANPGPLKDWGLAMQGNHITVDGLQRTSVPGIFAAGDICAHHDYGNLKLIVVGQAQAAVAVGSAKMYMEPGSKLFPGHSSASNELGTDRG